MAAPPPSAPSAAQQQLHGALSARGARAARPALSYFAAFMAAAARPWSEADPGGNIIVTVAENRLSDDLIAARLADLGPAPQARARPRSPPPAAVLAHPPTSPHLFLTSSFRSTTPAAAAAR